MMKMTDEQKKLVEDNVKLAAYMAHKWLKKGTKNFDYDEIFSLFSFALCKAASTFDINKGTRFATYAGRCMENEIKMAFRRRTRGSGEAREMLLSSVMNTDDDGNEIDLQNLLANDDHLVYDRVLDVMYAKEAIKILQPREFIILQERYFHEQNQRTIANQLNLSQSYVSRMEKRIIDKLHKWGKEKFINAKEVI